MVHLDFHDAALVLVGHGSTTNAESAAPVFQHAAALRARRMFAEVREGFWKQDPRVGQVIAAVAAKRVFVVPLFISEGYFSEEIIPGGLGLAVSADPSSRVSRRGEATLFYCRPVGGHESMTRVLLARARGVVEEHPFPRRPRASEISLFIAGHGTGQNENSRRAIERQVELIRGLDEYAQVEAVFIEEEPRIERCHERARTSCVVVVPFFMSDGMHVREDVPILLGEAERVVRRRVQAGQSGWRNPTEKRGRLVWYAAAVGTAPELADVVVERVCEAAGWVSAQGGGDA